MLPEGPVEVQGSAWIDREWSSQPLSEGQTGWDWFSLHLDGGARLMGFRLRDEGWQRLYFGHMDCARRHVARDS